MMAYVHILAVVFVAVTPLVSGQERCSYMTAIPREPRPDDLPAIEWEGGWSQRPFIPAPDREDLCMDQYIEASTTQIIYMDEEIEGDIAIARLNYDGSSEPYITFLSGSRNLLGPELRLENGEWFLYITQRQDYETPGMQFYVFNIRMDGETLIGWISLQIVNIDDNDPIIHVLSTCQVPELGEPRLTECVYEVTDADGEISTRFMTFELNSDRAQDEELFYVVGNYQSSNWFSMTMTIGINSALDFESNPLHIFQVTALDSLPNSHTVTLMVQVENVESRPPRWVEIFAVQQFDEKTAQTFTVRAIDGDTGINKPIEYKLETAEEDTFFSIETIEGGHSGAILHIEPIDRDYLEREVFQFSIIAHKYDDESFATTANIVIIVNDINDQIPQPLHEEYFVSIMEETPLTLNFEDEFGFHDRDLGAHAQYELSLESVSPPGAESAFYIAPEVGYQRQTFIMGTVNHTMLDYEVPEFQHITLRVIATDLDNPSFVGVALLHIDLINWNDEQPIFESSAQTVSFDETEGAGFFVANVRANDRDIGDRVEHTIMGNAVEYLDIDIDTGDITISVDNAFDYHRQNQLFIQVRADDTLMAPYNTATSQLIIELQDINNTPPTMRLPRGSPQVEENVPEDYEITSTDHVITATDPDTTAYLQFEIDWDTSYATKQGRETDPVEFHGCVDIETVFPIATATGSAIGRVVVKEIRPGVTIDFEEFEVLYLTVRVRDLNTVIGDDYDESTFTITIIDMNDNPPIWVDGTLTQEFRVRELSATNTVIGSVLATDIDGPLYNQVRYSIFPREDTPENLVKIDFYTGQIAVDSNAAIDADIPPRWTLYYTVIASDRCYAEDPADCPPDPTYWDTEGEISIQIIDTNNKVPEADTTLFNTTVSIYEDAVTGDDVVQLYSIDLDRDEIYNSVSYQINYAVNPRLRDFFEVELSSGRVYVNYIGNDVLDRDGDEPTHRIFFQFIDNFMSQGDTNRNQIDVEVLVILLDVNDNAPELPTPSELSWTISESLAADVTLEPDIYAPDRDEPDTDNSRVGYRIITLTITNREIEVPDLFYMRQVENVTGELVTTMDLRGYWGTYEIFIEAFDHGIPQQRSNETYSLIIAPYNFHQPQFVFPSSGATVRLSREWALPGVILRTVDNENLDTISATDEDGLEAGVVTFHVQGDADAEEYFEVINHGNNIGTLQLRREVTDQIREFQVTIRGTDGGTDPGPLFADSNLHVVFVPVIGDPVFEIDVFTIGFFEQEGGLSENFQLPLATDPKNYLCEGDCHDIYYRISDGNDAGHFALDPVTNVISLVTMLDRNETDAYTLVVAASNSPNPTIPSPTSTLNVYVTVRESDPRPRFERHLYTAGISVSDSVNRELLTVQATHSEGAAITYNLDLTSMVADPTLEAVQETAFILNRQTGLLTLNIQPTAAMQGMFEFNIIAEDPAEEMDTTEVKVYVVSSINTVSLIFLNTVTQIEDNRNFIAQTFSNALAMTCNIDQILPATDQNGVASETSTEMRSHFIQNDIAVHADVVYDILTQDTATLIAIRNVLLVQLIVLQDITGSPGLDSGFNISQIMTYVLSALVIALALLVLILLLTLFIKTKTLNRRLEALSTNKYGSLDSGLNRVGFAAPGTNMHAVEGSNPIWNEAIRAPDFEALSDTSGDSDLIGIEDMPQFRSDYFPEDSNDFPGTSRNDMPDFGVATHNNNFGFNASPFSNEFTNSANNGFKRRM